LPAISLGCTFPDQSGKQVVIAWHDGVTADTYAQWSVQYRLSGVF